VSVSMFPADGAGDEDDVVPDPDTVPGGRRQRDPLTCVTVDA
jgi:hypothetical protein